jgi:hypothetical protein
MNNLFKIAVATMLLFSMTGCASYMVMKHSKRKVAYRRAVARGDDAAIKAIRLGDGAGIGIDVTNIDAIMEEPLLQLGAALLDAAIIYGGYEGIRALNDDDDDDGGERNVHINGDNNNVTVEGDNNGNGSGDDNSNHSTTGE